ncbi:hypothetical protein D3C87_1937650 [compost metagenome]
MNSALAARFIDRTSLSDPMMTTPSVAVSRMARSSSTSTCSFANWSAVRIGRSGNTSAVVFSGGSASAATGISASINADVSLKRID